MLAENVTFNTPDWIHRKIRATLIETLRKCNTLTPNEPPISAIWLEITQALLFEHLETYRTQL